MSQLNRSMILSVIGPNNQDNATFMGSILYRCGLDLALIEQLEKAKCTRHDEIVTYMRTNKLTMAFHTPKNHCIFQEASDPPDAAISVFTIKTAPSDAVNFLQSDNIAKKMGKDLKLLVFVDNMHEVDWESQHYYDFVKEVEAGLKNENVIFVPISSLKGDNLLELSNNSQWYTSSTGACDSPTAVEAIDL